MREGSVRYGSMREGSVRYGSMRVNEGRVSKIRVNEGQCDAGRPCERGKQAMREGQGQAIEGQGAGQGRACCQA